jgi:transitional endoplasmic reticulum ATPase
MIRDLITGYEEPGFRMFADDLDLAELAALAAGMTGADLREVLRRVRMDKAMREARTGVRSVPIAQADLRAAIRALR